MGRMIYAFLFALLFTACGPNLAYLHRDWPRFEAECERYCEPEQAHPTRNTDPWTCGCPDSTEDSAEDSWVYLYYYSQAQY